MIKEKENNKKILILTSISLLFWILFIKIFPIKYFYCSITCIVVLLFSHPFAWTKEYKKNGSSYGNFSKFDVVLLVLIIIFFLTKLIINLYFYFDINNQNFYHKLLSPGAFLNVVVITAVEAFSEELVWKTGTYRYLISLKINKKISMLLVSLLFALMHFLNGEITVIAFISILLIQFCMLFVFDKFPSVWLVTLIHFGANIGLRLLGAALNLEY